MKKVSLLLLSASLCASAFAGEQYLIKDGKLAEGVTYEQWFDGEGIGCALLTEGDGFATLQHVGQYYDASLKIAEANQFSIMGSNLVVEYQLPAEAMMYDETVGKANSEAKTAAGKDKPTLIISTSKGVDEDAKFEYSHKNNISFANIDGKFDPAAEKGFVPYKQCAFAKNNDKVATVFLACVRENPYSENGTTVKIKNIYFQWDEMKDFFSCAFDSKDTWSETTNYAYAEDADGSTDYYFNNYDKKKSIKVLNEAYGDYTADLKMLYQNGPDNWTGSDGSGYLSSELYHGLLVKGGADWADEIQGQDVILAFKDIELPALNDNKMKISFLACQDPKSTYTLTGEDAKAEILPVYYQFDNGDETIALADSVIRGPYTLEETVVAVPEGAKSVSIYFKQNPNTTYIVDNFVLSADYAISVAKVSGDSKSLSIYPNPVADEISFDGVEAESVKIVSLNGASVPAAVVNGKVNVSNLAAGEYVIIVNNAISGKFIKK